ncbi:transglutaminase domain-containing protein [Anaerosporobacter sp.]
MKLKKRLSRIICISLSAVFVLTSCGKQIKEDLRDDKTALNARTETEGNVKDTIDEEENANDTKLLSSLREKYGEVEYDYADSIIHVDREEDIQLTLEFDPYGSDGVFALSEYFSFYEDDQMKYEFGIDCAYSYDEETKVLTISPPYFGLAEIEKSIGSDISINDLNGTYLFDDYTGNWGNFNQFYLLQKCDTKTGKELEKPIITIYKVDSEIKEAPQVTFSCNEDGYAQISWNKVEGAKEYLLFTIDKSDKDGFLTSAFAFARTTETSWTSSDLEVGGQVSTMNNEFMDFSVPEDFLNYNEYDNEFDKLNEEYFGTSEKFIGVIAINEAKASPISNLISLNEYSKKLPYELADLTYLNEVGTYLESFNELPSEAAITLCDGSITRRIVEYENKVKYDGSNDIYIRGTAQGTNLSRDYYIANIDVSTAQKELKELIKRQESLKAKSGYVNSDIKIIDFESTVEKAPEKEETTTEEGQDSLEVEANIETNKVTANSALSEYIAIHLLKSEEMINLSVFTESRDTDIVIDAFREAMYQNPLVMGIDETKYNEEDRILYVKYDDSAKETEEKRQQVIQKSKDIIKEIIDEDMTSIEKEIAINQYLCEHAEYDDTALENVESNNFKKKDKQFNDSFTVYGVLINGVGVCASYAGAFKVLADEAGLESIVVTGVLNGNIPHAWNRVNIDNQWVTVDVTNNDSDEVGNALLNVSDMGINGILVADDDYVIDEKLYDYYCDEEDNEYYRYNKKYFDIDTITENLVEELSNNGEALLRTQYDITDKDFNKIMESVADETGMKIEGYCWLGVIYMSK